jgi:hypothetical protein
MSEPCPDGRDKRRIIERLVEVAFESRRFRPLVISLADEAAYRDDWRVMVSVNARQLSQEFEAIHLRHTQVTQHEIGIVFGHHVQCF